MPVERQLEIETEEYYENPKPFNGNFEGADILSVEQFTQREEVERIFAVADEMRRCVENRISRSDLDGQSVALLFYQPSSRTYSSFHAATQRLGASYETPMHGMTAYSSAVKGESLADTIRTFHATTAADIIVLRHPDDNSSEIAAHFSPVPVINAGSGRKEHPTQAVLDTVTVNSELGRIDGLVVTATGDLRNGRTIKSFAKLLAIAGEGVTFNFISPEVLKMPESVIKQLEINGATVNVGSNGDLDYAIEQSDVLYVTRIQDEWFVQQALEDIVEALGDKAHDIPPEKLLEIAKPVGQSEYSKAVTGYVIDEERMKIAKQHMIVVHPLPRVTEISPRIDKDPRSAYFRQMRYGLYSRMALLSMINGTAQ